MCRLACGSWYLGRGKGVLLRVRRLLLRVYGVCYLGCIALLLRVWVMVLRVYGVGSCGAGFAT